MTGKQQMIIARAIKILEIVSSAETEIDALYDKLNNLDTLSDNIWQSCLQSGIGESVRDNLEGVDEQVGDAQSEIENAVTELTILLTELTSEPDDFPDNGCDHTVPACRKCGAAVGDQ